VALRADPARGDPTTVLPVNLQVRVADAFWVPETQEWWYWIGIDGFNGWVTGEAITRHAPLEEAADPAAPWAAYDWISLAGQAALRALPGEAAETAATAPKGTEAQVKAISWQPETDTWWYYCESTAGEGWVPEDLLKR
jgi:hypothetical protein